MPTPNLPGYTQHEIPAFKVCPITGEVQEKMCYLPQTFYYENGIQIEKAKSAKIKTVAVSPHLANSRGSGFAMGSDSVKEISFKSGTTYPESTTRSTFKPKSLNLVGSQNGVDKDVSYIPAWRAFDKHCLRFDGYFKEAVAESSTENFRVRQIVITYYLEDDTMTIFEKKIENSGLSGGTLVRRHRFPRNSTDALNIDDNPNELNDESYVLPADLNIGIDFQLYGTTYRLTNCDDYTRDFYREHFGQEYLNPSEDIPSDTFVSQADLLRNRPPIKKKTEEKKYWESLLGAPPIDSLKCRKLYEYDRMICSFYAILDDTMTTQFERRPFRISYSLGDDMLEISELYPMNSGRDKFPLYLKKSKLLKDGSVPFIGLSESPPLEDEYLQIEDFYVGTYMNLANRRFYIYDADGATRRYFSEQLGIELAAAVNVELFEDKAQRPPTPPYTGYGSWDDSLGCLYSLQPKLPKRDMHQLVVNEGKTLKVSAKFLPTEKTRPEDLGRRFVITYYLGDDNVVINEPPIRNSGFVPGKFIEKGIHLNQMTNNILCPADLRPGNIISILNHKWEILEADSFTIDYFEALDTKPDGTITIDANTIEAKSIPNSNDMDLVIYKFRECLRAQLPDVSGIFRRFDRDHNGVITFDEFREILFSFNFSLSTDEVIALMRAIDQKEEGQVDFGQFCEFVLDEDFSHIPKKLPSPNVDGITNEYRQLISDKSYDRGETAKTRRAVFELGHYFYSHPSYVKKIMKTFYLMSHTGTVSNFQINKALLQLGTSFDQSDIDRVILYILDSRNEEDLKTVPYVKFMKVLLASYHENNGPR